MGKRLVLAWVLACVTPGCAGRGDDDDAGDARAIESVSLLPETVVAASGGTVSFAVTMNLSDMSSFAPSNAFFEIDGVEHQFGCSLSGGGALEMSLAYCGVFVFATNTTLTLTGVDAGDPGEVSDTSTITVP